MIADTKSFISLLENFNLSPEKVAEIANGEILSKFKEVAKEHKVKTVFALLSNRSPNPRCRIFTINEDKQPILLCEWDLANMFIPKEANAVIKMASMFVDGLSRQSLIGGAQDSINSALAYNHKVWNKDLPSDLYGVAFIPNEDGVTLLQVRYAETRPIEIEPIKEAEKLSLLYLIMSGLNTASQLPPGDD